MTLRVLHLAGSAVDDFYCDLSRLYAADCFVATADPARYEFVAAYVTPDRRWRFPSDFGRDAIAAAEPVPAAEAVRRLVALDVDVMVPQMFCVPGMTDYRALFDLLAIPYVGNTPAVMSLAADKARTRAVVAAAGVRVPRGEVVRAGGRPTITPPVVVKPVDADNSLGVTLVRSPRDYDAALSAARMHADEVLVEDYIELGREVRCGIVVRDGALQCLPLEEYAMDAAERPIRGHGDKLRTDPDGGLSFTAKSGGRSWIVDPQDPVTQAVWDAAIRCHAALGCRHYSLFDFRVDPDGSVWFIEAGLYNSFARTSVITAMAAASGLPLDELFASLIGLSGAAAQPCTAPGSVSTSRQE